MTPNTPDQFEMPRRPISSGLVTAGLCLFIAVNLIFWRLAIKQRLGPALAEQSALSTEWTSIATQLQGATAAQSSIERVAHQSAWIAAERTKPRWTPALRAIAMAVGKEVEISDIRARAEPEDVGACECRVRGVVTGPVARLAGDRFRGMIEDHLKKGAKGRPVSVRFEQLEDEPAAPGTPADQQRARFVIVVTVGPENKPVAMNKEGL